MKKKLFSLILLSMLATSLATITGCDNTVHGIGKDMDRITRS